MDRTKRKQNDTIVHDYNKNKKQKLQNKLKFRSIFEDLANELFYEIFEYLDIYYVYKGFFNLNKRFKNLLIYSNLPIPINISTMSKSNFERYHQGIIKPNRHRINILRLSNPFTVDIVFSPPRIISKFIQLETLILDNTKAKYLDNILDHLVYLPKLYSLTLNLTDQVQYPSVLFSQIFCLPKLKYFKITYQTKDDKDPLSIYFTEYDYSPIEYLVINSRFSIETFDNLLFCLPKLRHLSINCLVKSHFEYIETKLDPVVLKDLKYVSLNLDFIHLSRFEQIIKGFFGYVEVLRLTTKHDRAYLDAKQWEHLISSYMPHLRVFDINHNDVVSDNNPLTYHEPMHQFNSSFWFEKKWFFTHLHDRQDKLDSGVFYSTNPYRRKDYRLYWELNKQLCPHVHENNLSSVKHVYICSKRATDNYVNYFPNAVELTIKHYFETPDVSIAATLNRMIPLEQLTKLVIECYHFPFGQMIKLIRFIPNLHSLKLGFLSFNELYSNFIHKTEIFQYVSNTNKIKNLELRDWCTLEKIQVIVNLFPQVEYLKTGIYRKEIEQIIRFLLLKTNTKTRHLFFLCLSNIPKVCLRELNVLIKRENLLDDYFIKFVNRDLYLWW